MKKAKDAYMPADAFFHRGQPLGLILQAHEKWLENQEDERYGCADLRGAELRGIDLRNANLMEADISEADLSRSDLSGARLSNAELRQTDLSRSRLFKTDFQQADLFRADFTASQLEAANFTEAGAQNADFSQTLLKSALFKKCQLNNACFERANMDFADFFGADLENANLNYASMVGSRFEIAGMVNLRMNHADCRGANFKFADLSGSHLEAADLRFADIRNANLNGTNVIFSALADADLEKTMFGRCTMMGTVSQNLRLKGSVQSDIVITKNDEPTISLDGILQAQMIHFLLRNSLVIQSIECLTLKAVLILGTFGDAAIQTLEAVKKCVRKIDRIPICYDVEGKFNTHPHHPFLKAIIPWVSFVIADISDREATPEKIRLISEKFPDTPIQPILRKEKSESNIAEDREKTKSIEPAIRYAGSKDLYRRLSVALPELRFLR